MNIKLVRIDDRLIHGQIVMAWTKAISVKRIIVINDKVAVDVIRKMLLETVAPPGIKVSVLSVKDGISKLQDNSFEGQDLMILFTNPTDVLAVKSAGVAISTVNIGGMSFSQGKKQLTKSISLDDADIAAFKKLAELGCSLQIQVVPNDNVVDMMTKI
jgi:mannose/fructose/sorbose-specific phosphotransferase system IIB component